MGLFRPPDRSQRQPQKYPRRHLLAFLILLFIFIKLIGAPKNQFFHHIISAHRPPPAILSVVEPNDDGTPAVGIYHLTGIRVRESGTYLDLGDRRTHLPASLLSRFFPDELIVPSCLTQPSPALPTAIQPTAIHDNWPGFYGAPWIARVNGNLIALLDVYAPRNTALPVAAPRFQIYPNYTGQPIAPSLSLSAPATFTRGSKAVLYRVFINGPIRCLDLVVPNGENNGLGHLYYRKNHHYYETDATFQVQP